MYRIPQLLPIEKEGKRTVTAGPLLQIHNGNSNKGMAGRSNNKSLHRSGVRGMTSPMEGRTGNDDHCALVSQNIRFCMEILGILFTKNLVRYTGAMTAEERIASLEEQLKQALEQLHETQEPLRVAQSLWRFREFRPTTISLSAVFVPWSLPAKSVAAPVAPKGVRPV